MSEVTVGEEAAYEGTMRWFGKKFDANMYIGMPEVEPRIGEDCLMCHEPILEGDPGLTIPFTGDAERPAGQYPMHVECHLRSIIGSPEHLDGNCSCFSDHPKGSGKSYRQEAIEVVERIWGKRWRDGP